MIRLACLLQTLLATLIVGLPRLAQFAGQGGNPTTQAADEKEPTDQRRTALGMLDQVLAGAKNLSLPQNRIAIEAEAFPILWGQDGTQARMLINDMVGDFAQAASQQDEKTDSGSRQMLRQQWQAAIQSIAQADAEMALNFLAASRSYVSTGNPEAEEAEERQLRLNLAAQDATHNPRRALQAAQKELEGSGDLPYELINLLSQIAANDAEVGAQLLHDIVRRVKGEDLVGGHNFGFALNLVNAEFSRNPNARNDGHATDDALKTIVDAVVSAALNPSFPQNMLPSLQGSEPTFDQLAPSKAQALRQKVADYYRTLDPEQRSWNDFNEAQASGDSDQLLAVAAHAPPGVRSNLYQQIAWKFANDGDLQRARHVADNLADTGQRNQILQQAVRQAAWSASNKGEFATARQFAQQITPVEERATTLAQLALNATGAKQEAVAQEMLEEAASVLSGRSEGAALFSAQLEVAQVLIRLRSTRAVPLLERSANQLEQVLAAAAQVDAFLPYQRSFEDGELMLNGGFLFNSLIRPYAQAAAELAGYNLPMARVLVDRLPLPEARLMAELYVARGALLAPATVARVSTRIGYRDHVTAVWKCLRQPLAGHGS